MTSATLTSATVERTDWGPSISPAEARALNVTCGALVNVDKGGTLCRLRPRPGSANCARHEGWSETATDQERHRLAQLELAQTIALVFGTPEPDDGTAKLRAAEARLERLTKQELTWHGRDHLPGSALEREIVKATHELWTLKGLDTEELPPIPAGGSFDLWCRCGPCRAVVGPGSGLIDPDSPVDHPGSAYWVNRHETWVADMESRGRAVRMLGNDPASWPRGIATRAALAHTNCRITGCKKAVVGLYLCEEHYEAP